MSWRMGSVGIADQSQRRTPCRHDAGVRRGDIVSNAKRLADLAATTTRTFPATSCSWRRNGCRIASITASANSLVPAVPPTSRVRCLLLAVDVCERRIDLVGGLVLRPGDAASGCRSAAPPSDWRCLCRRCRAPSRAPLRRWRTRVPKFAPGTSPRPPTKAAHRSRDDVAVEILQQQHVVLVGIHHQLHAGVVHDVLAVGDLGIFLRDVARAADEQAVRQLHDVGFVDGVDLLALAACARIRRRTARCASRPSR